MDRLQETFDRGDTITGVATGYTDIDELLSGLQPSSLYIVGARPAMGKCVAWDTPMVDVSTGEAVAAAELMDRAVARGGLDMLSLDAEGRQARSIAVGVSRRRREAGVQGTNPFRSRRATITASEFHC